MKLQTLAFIAALTPVIGACASYGPATNATASTSAVQVVEMTPDLTFSPVPLRISAGGTVEFRNVSGFVHTVSTVPDTAGERATVQLPSTAVAFDSGPIEAGGVYRQTFDVPGTYRYFCDPHHGAGMIGTIVVSAQSAQVIESPSERRRDRDRESSY